MVQLFRVAKIYPPNYPALKDIYLQIDKGEFVFVNGPSGAGKTTLLRLLFRAEDASEGQIVVNGRNITRLDGKGVAELRRELGLVFQEFKLLPTMTALENVALAAQVVGVSRQESKRKAFHLLRELGLKDKHDARPPTLSGGEQQRVAIARALVNEPMLVLADEPTGNLDAETAEETMRLFLKIHERGTTVLLATHDTGVLKRFGCRAVFLQRGELVGDSKQESGEARL
ncbi:MAG: cell division ATP-binding protein FtsE [Deltaproteobacteria bacterium]|nr:MAG: cell division ATP-binding protein FtsE [Deltaproteobacteria bacterium]